jgi:hypothetical protein
VSPTRMQLELLRPEEWSAEVNDVTRRDADLLARGRCRGDRTDSER